MKIGRLKRAARKFIGYSRSGYSLRLFLVFWGVM